MASTLPFDNPIAFAHLQLRGGWKNVLWTSAAYGVAVVLLILLSLRLNPKNSASIYSVWTGILLGVQGALLLLFGANTVNNALRTDVSTGMIESHRLMPIPAMVVVAGYMLGPSVQAIVLSMVTFVIGALTTGGAQKPFATWAIPNAVLGFFALFLWTISVFTNLSAKNGFRWVVSVFIIGSVTQGMIFYLLPGLLLLMAPVIGSTIFMSARNRVSVTETYALALAAQLALGVIFYLGAARKFRNAEAPALSPLLGLMLLAGWVGISMAGIAYWHAINPFPGGFGPGTNATVQAMASIGLSMLLAATPIASAARLQAEYQRRKRIHDLSLPARSMPPMLTVVISAALVSMIALVAEEPEIGQRAAATWTAVVVLANLVSLMYVLRVLARRRAKALMVVGAFLIATWSVPMLIDFLRHGLGDFETPEVLGVVSSASPIGAMVRLWTGNEVRPVPGVYVQIGIAVCLGLLYHTSGGRKAPVAPVPMASR